MRNRRLVLIGLIVLVLGVAAALLLPNILGGDGQPDDETPTPTPVNMVQVVISAQELRRGQEITQDAVILQEWPIDSVPLGAFTALENTYSKIARQDIPRGMPVTESMLTLPGVGDTTLIGAGSDASWMIPEGRVAYPIPVTRYTSVAWALKPGDHVDVLLSLSMVDMDEEFHTVLPNQVSCFSSGGGEDAQPTCPTGPMGRFEVLPNGVLVNVIPSGDQVPRLVTQLTVQDAIVLRVGDWSVAQAEEGEQAPQVAEGDQQQQQGEAEEGQPVQPTQRPVTLAVSPQDAAVLEFAWLSDARVTLLLRRAGDETATFTEPVTLQYLLDRYSVEVPSKLPYGLAPSDGNEAAPPVE